MHISVFQYNNSFVPNGERESSGRTQIQTFKIIGSVSNFEKWIKMKKKRVRALYSIPVRFMLQPENITVKLAVLVFIKYMYKKETN